MWDPIKLTIKARSYHVINVHFSTELSSYRSMYHVISWAPGSLAHLGWDVGMRVWWNTQNRRITSTFKNDLVVLYKIEQPPWQVAIFQIDWSSFVFQCLFLLTHLLPIGHQCVWTSNVLLPSIWLFNLYIHVTALIFLEFVTIVFFQLKIIVSIKYDNAVSRNKNVSFEWVTMHLPDTNNEKT